MSKQITSDISFFVNGVHNSLFYWPTISSLQSIGISAGHVALDLMVDKLIVVWLHKRVVKHFTICAWSVNLTVFQHKILKLYNCSVINRMKTDIMFI